MRTLLLSALVFSSLSACVSMTPAAKSVMLYSQDSTLLGGCKRLGPVASEINLITRATKEDGVAQVKNNLRDQAFAKYQADSVVLLNLDVTMTRASAEGIAFKCNGTAP
jgi:hypothetical protein